VLNILGGTNKVVPLFCIFVANVRPNHNTCRIIRNAVYLRQTMRARQQIGGRKQCKKLNKQIQDARIYSIEQISETEGVAYHHDGNAYKICMTVKATPDGDISFVLNQQDINRLAALPLPEIKLAHPSVLQDIPYFK